MQTIHFKVAAQNSIRRFVIIDPTYNAVRRLVSSLFGLAVDDSWSLQYKDEENQLITFSSDEELKFACHSNPKLLYLQVANGASEVSKKDKRDKERARKPRSAECLIKKQARLRDRILSLAEKDSPRAKSQVEKLENKLADVTAELEQLSRVVPDDSNSSMNVQVTPILDVLPPSVPPTESKDIVPVDEAPKTSIPTNQLSVFNKQLLNDVSSKFYGLRREVHQERMRILSLSKVLKALQVLSRHGSRTDCGVQVNTDQVDQTKASLVVAKEEFSAKKSELRNQAQLLRVLERQQRQFLSFKKKEKKHWKGRNSDKSDKVKRTWRREKPALSDSESDASTDSDNDNVWKEKREKKREEKRALRRDMKDRKEKREKNFDKEEKRMWRKDKKEGKEKCEKSYKRGGMRRHRDDSARSEKTEF